MTAKGLIAFTFIVASIACGPKDEPTSVSLNGRLEAPLVDLAPKVSGRVIAVRVKEGDRVKAGDVLIELDLGDTALSVERDRHSVQSARARFQDLAVGSREAEIAAAVGEVDDRRAAVDLAERELERQTYLVSKEVGAPRDYDRAKTELDRAKASLKVAEERLSLTREGFRRWQTAQARSEVDRAETQLRQSEIVAREGSHVRIPEGVRGVNVRHRGEDVRAGTVVLPGGRALRPQELGVAASLGLPQLLVRQKPRVAILSTGDEVAEPGDERKPGQIFDSNRFSLHGLVEAAGGQATDHGIVPDLYDVLHAKLRAAAATADIVLTSGGVSVGDYDLVKAVLQDAGGIDFWQVAMQPGRPLAVGRIGAAHFFGLPGNPVASMLTFHLFVRPALWKLAGRSELFPPTFHAVAMEPMAKKAGRREFKRGVLSYASTSDGGGRWEVRTTGPQGSGILTSMTLANCFVIIEEERGDVAAGDSVTVELFSAS